MGRGNKLAALAAASTHKTEDSINPSGATTATPTTGRGNKLAALAASNAITNASTAKEGGPGHVVGIKQQEHETETAETAAMKREQHLVKLKERLSKRRDILDKLDRAEALTCNLLKIAAKTTDALQDMNGSPDLSELSVAYRATLQELHPLLTKGTEELIKPYQNHTMETKQSMYAARVEMRLAKERLDILKTFTMLEKNKGNCSALKTERSDSSKENNRKRPREETVEPSNKTTS
jgi:hypothetical protein